LASDIVGLIIGYLFGSIPTAYLLVHWIHRVDIRNSGSGNVGALNTYEVTGSSSLGIVVMVVDAAKGAVAVLLAAQLGGFWPPALSGIGAVLGHTAPVWIGFKGGRGLATGAGVMLLMSWPVLLLWCLVWAVARRVSGKIHLANIVASATAGIAAGVLPAFFCLPLLALPGSGAERSAFCLCVVALVLISHRAPALELWQSIHTSSKVT
jgi:glycerol-3-phosphate acyltransferase PlsY